MNIPENMKEITDLASQLVNPILPQMEDLVTFEIAKKLKEKGFPIKTKTEGKFGLTKLKEVDILPTISQVLKWLREEYRLHIEPRLLTYSGVNTDVHTYWKFAILSARSGFMLYYSWHPIDDKRFNSYEQAALAGIEYALDNLI